MKNLGVLVVDDQRLIREGISSLLALQEGIEVVGSTENGREAIFLAREKQPDVILMDIRMPVLDGIAATKRIHEELPLIRIIMLTTFDDEEYIVKSLKAGASGYLMKDIPIEDLSHAIRAASGGSGVMAPGILGTVAGKLGIVASSMQASEEAAENQSLWNSFSVKEQEILRCLARGDVNREIAEAVNLSEGTVKNYISGILATLDLRDRTQAALFAMKNGWAWE